MGIDGVGPKVATNVGGTVEPKKIEKTEAPPPAPSAPGIKAKLSEGFDDLKKKLMSTTGKYVAHQIAVPDRPDLKDAVAAQRSSISAGEGKFVGASSISMNAKAEKEMAPLGKTEQVNLSDPDQRMNLMRSTSQVNEVSKKAGNENDICGGAAMTNGLIMSSDTPEKAKANAAAVRSLAKDLDNNPNKPFIKPEEETALKHMEAGKMSPTDVAHMQQLMYRTEQRMPLLNSNPNGTGTSTAQVGCALTMLKARGGFPGPNDVTFHQTSINNGQANHWTVSSGGLHANSAGGAKFDKSQVMGGPSAEYRMNKDGWQNEIHLDNSESPAKVTSQYRKDIPGKDGKPATPGYEEATFNPADFGSLQGFGEYEKKMRQADTKPPTPIE